MNRKGELSNKHSPIVAINFETIFSKKVSLKDRIFGDKLKSSFDERFRALTYTLYQSGFNVYITSFNDIEQYEDEIWGKYIFFNKMVRHKDMEELFKDCRFRFSYYIDEKNSTMLLDNSYSLEKFLELF